MPKRKTLEEFIKQSNNAHNFKYDYSCSVYNGTHNLIEIKCNQHGNFWVTAKHHIHSLSGCPICGIGAVNRKRKLSKSNAQFIEDAKNAHGDKYDYSMTKYVNGKTDVLIGCQKHGLFCQRPENHVNNKAGKML